MGISSSDPGERDCFSSKKAGPRGAEKRLVVSPCSSPSTSSSSAATQSTCIDALIYGLPLTTHYTLHDVSDAHDSEYGLIFF
jgi:hypothetical protein